MQKKNHKASRGKTARGFRFTKQCRTARIQPLNSRDKDPKGLYGSNPRFVKIVSFVFLVLSQLFLLTVCSFDYGQADLDQKIAANTPNSILEDFLHVAVKNGSPVFKIYALRAENFDTTKETILTNVYFQEFNAKGEIVNEGWADQALFFNETENAELNGNLYMYSENQGATLRTDYLFWNNQEKKLVGKENATVNIEKRSGTYISGDGFSVDVNTNTVEFKNNVHGKYIIKEE